MESRFGVRAAFRPCVRKVGRVALARTQNHSAAAAEAREIDSAIVHGREFIRPHERSLRVRHGEGD